MKNNPLDHIPDGAEAPIDPVEIKGPYTHKTSEVVEKAMGTGKPKTVVAIPGESLIDIEKKLVIEAPPLPELKMKKPGAISDLENILFNHHAPTKVDLSDGAKGILAQNNKYHF